MEQITLDMIPNSHTPIAHISQYDSGRHIRFNLQNITLTGSEAVTLKIRKTDGELVSKTIENHTSYVEYVSDKSDCDASGKANCEIVISKDDVVIGSKNFILNIEADPYDDAGVITKTASGRIATFETNIADVLQSLKCEINASGGYDADTQTEHPIVGHSELNLTRCGANLFDDAYVDNNLTAEQILPAGTYYIKAFVTGSSEENRRFSFYFNDTWNVISSEGTFDDGGITWSGSTFGWLYGNATATITLTHAYKIRASVLVNTYLTRRYAIYVDNSISTFVNYNGQTFTVAFGQTVYGGVYDKSGRLTITHGIKDLGTLNYNYDSDTPRFWTNEITDIKHPSNNAIAINGLADIYKVVSFDDLYYRYKENGTIACSAAGVVSIINTAYTDAPTFKTAMSGHYLCYELATPIVIDVDAISVFAENGTNNIFHDGNGDTEVKYLYIA